MKPKQLISFFLFFLIIWVLQAWLLAPERGLISDIDLVISGFLLPGYVLMFFGGRFLFTIHLSSSFKALLFFILTLLVTGLSYRINSEIDLSPTFDIYFVTPFLIYELGLIHLALGIIGLGFGGIESAYANMQLGKEIEQLKKLEAQSREKNLIQHLQPHFMFNALNTIYALARKNQPETPKAILELADLLRYSLDASKKEHVTLVEEVHFLNAYCDFQQKRLPKHIAVVKQFEILNENMVVFPLLFQPIVENAFKYVDTTQTGEILIQWIQTDKSIHFTCSNPVSESPIEFTTGSKRTTGSGLQLFAERLKALYGTHANFNIDQIKHNFTLTCTINL